MGETLDDREFQDLVDQDFMRIEDAVDELDVDIDIDSAGGVLTFTAPDQSQIILSRQVANHEIWVAAKSGGFHLKKTETSWYCDTTSEDLEAIVNRVFTEQAGLAVFN